jgi:hypothetical protein
MERHLEKNYSLKTTAMWTYSVRFQYAKNLRSFSDVRLGPKLEGPPPRESLTTADGLGARDSFMEPGGPSPHS